jgi:transposase
VSTFYRYVARVRAEQEAGAAPVIRFEGLPGEYAQWDWGEARVPLGGTPVKRVFLAGRLKYSRAIGLRWRRQMDLETLARTMLEIAAGWGGVPWAWVFDNMKTVTLGRDATGAPRWTPAFWRLATEVGFVPLPDNINMLVKARWSGKTAGSVFHGKAEEAKLSLETMLTAATQ